jgi:hypothetical protein
MVGDKNGWVAKNDASKSTILPLQSASLFNESSWLESRLFHELPSLESKLEYTLSPLSMYVITTQQGAFLIRRLGAPRIHILCP